LVDAPRAHKLAASSASRLRRRLVPVRSRRPISGPLAGLVLILTVLGSAVPDAQARPRQGHSTAAKLPVAGREAIRRGLEAVDCAIRAGEPPAKRLAVIDYRLPSSRPRLWVLDLATGKVLFEEWVAHGRGSGEARAVRFSNIEDSKRSSLGLYRTLETYEGDNGYSLRLQGLETGFNDRAGARSIVMHGADYVSPAFIRTTGRLGRSYGCPAVRREIARPLIDSIKNGQYLFAYYPDAAWLTTSAYLDCTHRGVVKARARQQQEAGPSRHGVSD
jgi:hypothetical protein